jgi:hypothetical protein
LSTPPVAKVGLKSGDFTDLIVLAYTDPCKKLDILTTRQIGLDDILEGENASSKDLSREAQSKVLDAFANTPEAHKRFKKWLAVRVPPCAFRFGPFTPFQKVPAEMPANLIWWGLN